MLSICQNRSQGLYLSVLFSSLALFVSLAPQGFNMDQCDTVAAKLNPCGPDASRISE